MLVIASDRSLVFRKAKRLKFELNQNGTHITSYDTETHCLFQKILENFNNVLSLKRKYQANTTITQKTAKKKYQIIPS